MLALLPLTTPNKRALLDGLVDEDLRVCAAAAVSAGRLKLATALPRVTSCLRRGDRTLAHAAAAVLAGMPPIGWQALEDQTENPDPIASTAARKALEAARLESAASRMLEAEVA